MLMEIAKPARWRPERLAQRERRSLERSTLLRLLNEALATQIVCMLRYRRNHYMTSGLALMEEVLAREEEHAAALASLLQGVRAPRQVARA